MRFRACTTLFLILWLFPTITVQAEWPTTVEENLPIAADPDVYEGYPTILPYPDGSALVVLYSYEHCNCYQIVDRYGEMVFPELLQLAPSLWDLQTYNADAVPDNEGGAYAVWPIGTGSNEGHYAQRLDSLGRRMWGDAGIAIIEGIQYLNDYYYLSSDGMGGFFYLYGVNQDGELRILRYNGEGEPLWGDLGVVVCINRYQKYRSKVIPDGSGGAYVVWWDLRPPYSSPGALFMQRLDPDGNPLWQPDGLFLFYHPWFHEMIPDGEGGFIVYTSAGDWNTVIRVDPDGHIMWTRDNMGHLPYAHITTGEPGYFYLTFNRYWDFTDARAQRMDILGNYYWGGQRMGISMAMYNSWESFESQIFAYQYPYFYGVLEFSRSGSSPPTCLRYQVLDSLGNKSFGDEGIPLAFDGSNVFRYLNLLVDGDGQALVVWQTIWSMDVWAKHVMADGAIGGPVYSPCDVSVELTPYGTPIEIPASGGSFSYNIEVVNYEAEPVPVDFWTMCFTPDSAWVGPLLGPVNLTLQGGDSLGREREQNVPYMALSGTYTYYSYVGDYPFETWDSDSFQFQKLESGDGLLRDDWEETGESWSVETGGGSLSEADEHSALQEEFVLLGAFPNPFNAVTTIRFSLAEACRVELEVFDINGRNVGFGESDLQWYPAGIYEVTFDGSGLASGIYLYRLEMSGSGPDGGLRSATPTTAIGKMVLMK